VINQLTKQSKKVNNSTCWLPVKLPELFLLNEESNQNQHHYRYKLRQILTIDLRRLKTTWALSIRLKFLYRPRPSLYDCVSLSHRTVKSHQDLVPPIPKQFCSIIVVRSYHRQMCITTPTYRPNSSSGFRKRDSEAHRPPRCWEINKIGRTEWKDRRSLWQCSWLRLS